MIAALQPPSLVVVTTWQKQWPCDLHRFLSS